MTRLSVEQFDIPLVTMNAIRAIGHLFFGGVFRRDCIAVRRFTRKNLQFLLDNEGKLPTPEVGRSVLDDILQEHLTTPAERKAYEPGLLETIESMQNVIIAHFMDINHEYKESAK